MRHSHVKKTIIAFLTIAMLMPGVYLAFRPVTPARAQIVEVLSIPNAAQWIKDIAFGIVETMLYKTLKNLAKSFGEKLAKTALLEFATGQKGQEPLFSAKNWEKEMKDAGNNAMGFALEGAAKGFEKGFKRSQKAYNEKKAGEFDLEAEKNKGIAAEYTQDAKNMGMDAAGARADRKKAEDKGNRFGAMMAKADEDMSLDAQADFTNRAKDAKDKADAAAQKSKNIKDQIAATDKAQKKRDEADRRGQAGGTSDQVAAALNWLCNPSGDANISLKISLGIGNLGSDPEATPPCTGDILAKNWGAVYDKFTTMKLPEAEQAWAALADMVDPDSSEIGVAFNANNSFLDQNQKETMDAAIEGFINRLRGPDEEDEAGNIKTPGDLVRAQMTSNLEKGQEQSSAPGHAMTGKVLADTADIIGTFVDSFASQSMNYLKQGVVRNVKQWQDSLKKKDEGLGELSDQLQKQADAAAAQAKLDADKAALDLANLNLNEAKKDALPPLAALPPAEAEVTAGEKEKEKTAQKLAEDPTDPDALQRDSEATARVIQVQVVLRRVQAEVKRTQDDVARTQAAVTRAEQAVVESERQLASIMTAQPRAQTIDPSVAAATDALYNPDAAPSHGGIAATQQYLAKLTRVTGIDGGTMNTLAELRSTECTISANACVLGEAFANAIQQKMTVREAMEAFRRGESAGLNPSGVFGFENQSKTYTFGQALQPNYQTNFPYNSLVVLRKYRVLPVSWELAALYIKDHYGACGPIKSCTLEDMVNAFDEGTSPFFRLVDPNWVLKMPSVYCALKGYGPLQEKTKDTEQTMCKNDTNGDGSVCCDKGCLAKKLDGTPVTSDAEKIACLTATPPTCSLDFEEQTIVRSETCMDEQSCLQDDATGKCLPQMYGYCLEEKKLWRFKGKECKPVFASCDEFADKDTKIVNYYLKNSIVENPNVCNENTAGCQWYSKTRYVGAAKTALAQDGGNLVRDWNSAERAYFTPKVIECNAQAEGCRGIETRDLDGATSTIYAKIAPSYLKCDETINPRPTDITWKPPYRREECKSFSLHCAAEYTGCELYTPQEVGGFPIAAKNPTVGCEEACAGLTSYAIQKTRIESQLGLPQFAVDAAFIPTSPTVEQCLVSDVGCDEFTNIQTGAGAEQRDYFKEIRRCEKKPTKAEDVPVFYSPFGSNTGGYSLDKFIVKKDAHGAPACFGSEDCTCAGGKAGSEENVNAYYNQFINPNVTAINCRQFYVNRDNEGFNPEYYQLDKLIYLTDDCNKYRRTADEKLANKGSIYNISPSLSQTCSASVAQCRAFRDPTAGNIVMVDYSNFEDGTANGWGASTATSTLSVKASNESESLGNHSLEMEGNEAVGEVRFEKNNLLLIENVSYLVGLSMKVPVAATVRVELLGYEDAQGDPVDVTSTASTSTPAFTWRYLTFSFPKIQNKQPVAQGSSGVRITITPNSASEVLSFVLLDNITLKQASGVIYAIDDSWVLPDECLEDGGESGDKTNADPNQIGCKLYADRAGAQAVFRDVERLCPNEMVGCKMYNASSTPPLILVEDSSKACLQSNNGCTAYGVPTLTVAGDVQKREVSRDTHEENWITRYIKITPDETDAQRGSCPATAVGCKAYQISGQTGQRDRYFMDPGKKVCQWRAVTQKEIDPIMAQIGKSLTARLDEVGTLKKAGKWYYKVCSGDRSTACTTDKDCKDIGKGDCTEEVSCVSAPASFFPKACPADQRTCRKITDPECESPLSGKSCAKPIGDTDHDSGCETPEFVGKLRRDYGRGTQDVSCVRNYYYLTDAENKGSCNSRLDVEGGCLLFNDANEGDNKYNSNTWYGKYFDDRIAKDLSAANPSNMPTSGIDANVLLKVGLDRMCKTWLECTDYLPSEDDKKTICTNRAPCNERNSEDGTCANYIFEGSTDQIERGVLARGVFDTPTSTASRIPFATLTGMARPDLRFSKGHVDWLTTNTKITGHNSLFGWEQKKQLANQTSTLPIGQLYLKMSSATSLVEVVNSCRVRPRSDTPDVRYKPKITGTEELKDRVVSVNACDYENKKGDRYQGIDGYCIEPYPKFSDTYFSGDSSKNILPARADFASFGFKGACLNWYPAERAETAGFFTGASFASSTYRNAVEAWQGITSGDKDVYFCAEFGVNEHEQTLMNGSGDDIVLTIPKVDPIRAIGRMIQQCPDIPGREGDGHTCGTGDPESNQNMTGRAYKKATMRVDTMTIYHGEASSSTSPVVGMVGKSTKKVKQDGSGTESNVIPFTDTYDKFANGVVSGATSTFTGTIGTTGTFGNVPPNSTSVTSKEWKKVQPSYIAFKAAEPRIDTIVYFNAKADGTSVTSTTDGAPPTSIKTGTTETDVPVPVVGTPPTKGNTPPNSVTTRTAIKVVTCTATKDGEDGTQDGVCADGTRMYKFIPRKDRIIIFNANGAPVSDTIKEGTPTTRDGIPPNVPKASDTTVEPDRAAIGVTLNFYSTYSETTHNYDSSNCTDSEYDTTCHYAPTYTARPDVSRDYGKNLADVWGCSQNTGVNWKWVGENEQGCKSFDDAIKTTNVLILKNTKDRRYDSTFVPATADEKAIIRSDISSIDYTIIDAGRSLETGGEWHGYANSSFNGVTRSSSDDKFRGFISTTTGLTGQELETNASNHCKKDTDDNINSLPAFVTVRPWFTNTASWSTQTIDSWFGVSCQNFNERYSSAFFIKVVIHLKPTRTFGGYKTYITTTPREDKVVYAAGTLTEGTFSVSTSEIKFSNATGSGVPSGEPAERNGQIIRTVQNYNEIPRIDKVMYLTRTAVTTKDNITITETPRIEYWIGTTALSLTPKVDTGGAITNKPTDTNPTNGGNITGIPTDVVGILIKENIKNVSGEDEYHPYVPATFRVDKVTTADPTATTNTVTYWPGGKASSAEAGEYAKTGAAIKTTGIPSSAAPDVKAKYVFDTDQTGDQKDNDGYALFTTTDYSAAKPRIDKVQYWKGAVPDGNPISRIGTIETTGSGGASSYVSNCATSYTDDATAYERSSCGLTPKSEIDAGEAKSDGTPINILPRNERPEKDPYTITAKATYRDVYCKRVVQVAKGGAMIPFFSKLPGVLGAQLTPAQVTEIAKGPIILQRIIKGGLAHWDGTKPEDPTWTTLSSDTNPWPALNPAFERYSYSDYDKAANQVYVLAQTNATRTWLEAAGDPIGTNASSTTRLDREQVAIEDAADNGALVPENSALIKGMTPKKNGLIGSLLVNNGTYKFQPELFNDLGPRLFTQAVGNAIDTLADGGSAKNFDADNFSYTTSATTPPIPFAKYYGQWTSIGIDNTFRGRTGGNGPIAFTHAVTAPGWFPDSNTNNSKTSATATSTYPKIYNELGAENLFSYVKAATTAPQIRNMVFYVDVDDDHLPLRELFIDWGDGAALRIIESDKGEGKGRNDSPPCSPHPWKADNPCSNLKFAYNHIFQRGKFDGKEVCIQAMDNWEQITRVCGTLKAPVEETDTGFEGNVTSTHSIK